MAFAATFPTGKLIFAPIFGMAKLLALETSKQVRYIRLDINNIIADFQFLGWFVSVEIQE